MAEIKKSEFSKVLSARDVLVIACGAMIGWGWVVSTGDWIGTGGVLGAILGFVVGGLMIFFVGLTYAELTTAMPQCGGEHVFSFKAMGPIGSFICTWAIILGYVGVVCFEACAFPTIITYIFPTFLKGYLYSVAGFDIYASWLVVSIILGILITYVNVRGVKTAAIVQTILTAIIGGVGILLVVASLFSGSSENIMPQLFKEAGSSGMIKSVISVAVMTPFFFIGFDVIPQAAEEINVPLKKIGNLLILSVIMTVIFYALVVFAVGFVMTAKDISSSSSGLVTADAMKKAFSSSIMAKVLIIGGMCGIITSWNSFMIGGSRAMYSMAESYMIPKCFAKLHPKHKTPLLALALIGVLSIIAPFFGRKMLVWVVDAGNFACCLAYCMVALSFIILRTKEPNMKRPYKVPHYKIMGALAVLMSGFMVVMYLLPFSSCALSMQEWYMVGGWGILGVVFFVIAKVKYKENFATHIDVVYDMEAFTKEKAINEAIALVHGNKEEAFTTPIQKAINFDYYLPINIAFGWGKVAMIGELTRNYGKKALIVTGASSVKRSGLYAKIKANLSSVGIDSVLFDKATPNPLTTTVAEGVTVCRDNACDFVLGVGGGSVMDLAKAIAFSVKNIGDISDYIYGKKKSEQALPIVLVPTTCGTGSEGNGFAVLTNPENGDKKSLRCNAIIAKLSIVDPECMTTMSASALATVGFDAFCHLFEAYTSASSQPFTDALCIYGLELIAKSLVPLYKNLATNEGKNTFVIEKKHWENITLASTIGGMVINTAGVTLCHAMEHPVSGLKNVTHGKGLAALILPILKASYKGEYFKIGKVASLFGGMIASDIVDIVQDLLENLGLLCHLSDFGISTNDIQWLTNSCKKVSAASIANSPIVFEKEQIAQLYKEAI